MRCYTTKFEKIDDYTVRIVMREPDPIITSHLVNPEFSILPPKYYSEHTPEEVVFAPVGAGGYKFVSYKAGEGLVLTAFDKYRLGKPPVQDVIVKAVPEVATRIAEIQAGSADLMMGVPADLKASLESVPGVKVVVAPSYRRIFIAIKQGRHPALADVRVRQAMNYAFNCEEIARRLDRRDGEMPNRPGQHALQQSGPEALRLRSRQGAASCWTKPAGWRAPTACGRRTACGCPSRWIPPTAPI